MSILQIVMTSPLMSGPLAPTYTLYSYGGSDVNEGNNLVFIAGGTNIVDGTYYWTIENNAGDFAASSGSFTITGNNGSFIVTPTADATTEGAETFTVALREGSTSGTILVTSNTVTINDTSFGIGSFVINGSTLSWGSTNATSATYAAYTYPDGTSGSVHTFTGSQYVLSPQFGVSPTLNFNLWFYPTANNCQIMSEFGQAQENSGWHLSMLEINSSNKLKGRVWEMGASFPTPVVTSTGSVTLNDWNHVYFYYDPATATFGMSLNNETAVTQGGVNRHTPDTNHTYWGIGTYSSQTMGSDNRYQGRFDGLVINTTLVGSNYTATKAKYKPPLSLNFLSGTPYMVVENTQSDWNLGTTWTIEYWSKANAVSTEGNLYTVMGQAINSPIDILYIGGDLSLNGNRLVAEPTAGTWSHVALVGDGSNLKIYYNGASVYTGGAVNLNNSSNDLIIGKRGPGNFQYFNGKLALIRISSTAKYSGTFTPSTTYGVVSDTRLFLGSEAPLVDGTDNHPINNQGAVTNTDFPHIIVALNYLVNNGYATNYGANQIGVLIADYPAIATVPDGAIVKVSGQNSGTYTVSGQFTLSGVRIIASGFNGSANGSDTLTITW